MSEHVEPETEAAPPEPKRERRVLVTGASGYLGRRVVAALAKAGGSELIASDIAPTDAPGVTFRKLDVSDEAAVRALIGELRPEVIVHLAAIVTPPRDAPPDLAWKVDICGTRNVLAAAAESGVGKIIVTSSGAAYGYYADSPAELTEDDPIRGNGIFAYSHHKRLVEGMLADYRQRYPALMQLVLRVGTILGEHTKNQITAIFERPIVLGLNGASSPFNFVHDDDVAAIIVQGVSDERYVGTFNVAGEGTMSLAEIAKAMGKPYISLPVGVVRAGLTLLSRVGLAPYGPEQVVFLRHRPVLDNTRLIQQLGFRPRPTREVFELWRKAHAK